MAEKEYAWTEPKPSGIKLRDLYRTFDEDDGGIRRRESALADKEQDRYELAYSMLGRSAVACRSARASLEG